LAEEWEVVFIARDKLEAEVVGELLDSEGIPVRLSGESLGELYGLHTGPLAQVKILAPSRYAEEARNLIAAEIIESDPEKT